MCSMLEICDIRMGVCVWRVRRGGGGGEEVYMNMRRYMKHFQAHSLSACAM